MPPNSVIMGAPAKVVCSIEDYYVKRKSKQIGEAFCFAQSIIDRKHRQPVISDFPEEWCLFVTKEEYENNPIVKHNIDFRMCDYLEELWQQERPFNGFEDFIKAFEESK